MLFVLSFLLLLSIGMGFVRAQQSLPLIEIEHRFTALEIKVDSILTKMNEVESAHKYEFLSPLVLAVLAALKGQEIVQRRKLGKYRRTGGME